MKKNLLKVCFVFVAAMFMQLSSQAQFVVKIRPTDPVVVRERPHAPSPRHIWIDGEYVWRDNRYVYTEGRWALPAYEGAIWVRGHWKLSHRRGGWYWIPGHWSRR